MAVEYPKTPRGKNQKAELNMERETAAAVTFGGRPWVAPMLLPASAAILFAFLRSMVITLRQGGICWRDTFYPLADLRNGLYR